jgi:hypothetical protein
MKAENAGHASIVGADVGQFTYSERHARVMIDL